MYGISYPAFIKDVRDYLFNLLPEGAFVLDVGAGQGIYGHLLARRFRMQAVEVCASAVYHLRKSENYLHVWKGDIRTHDFHRRYDLIILGDIIEHMTVGDAQAVVKRCEESADYVLIAVPYCYKQGALYGNDAEIHIQDDLTPELFDERYPGYTRIFGDSLYGYYIKKTEVKKER